MKLSNDTITILKNFSTINGNLYFKKGNVISTITGEGHIFAQATIKEDFPSDFAIYDLHKFLGVLSLFESPEIEIGENSVEITQGTESVNYVFADPSAIVYPKKTTIELPEAKFSFNLENKYVTSIQKISAALGLEDLAIVTDGSDIVIKVHDKKNSSSNSHVIDINETSEEAFDIRFKVENLKILPGSYKVEIAVKSGIAVGTFENTTVKYWISSEADSKF